LSRHSILYNFVTCENKLLPAGDLASNGLTSWEDVQAMKRKRSTGLLREMSRDPISARPPQAFKIHGR